MGISWVRALGGEMPKKVWRLRSARSKRPRRQIECHPLEGACQVGVAVPGGGGYRPRAVRLDWSPGGSPTQPGFRFSWCRSETAPATHQDQGDVDLGERSIAPGAL